MIAHGPITQICWVTDDLEATERLLSEQLGTGVWTRIPDVSFEAGTTTLPGQPVEFTAHISLGYVELARVGPQVRELYAAVKQRARGEVQ